MTDDVSGLTEISGVVEDVVFRNEENSFTVMLVRVGDELITAVGETAKPLPGELITAEGSWGRSEKHGDQFRISSLTRSLPGTADGMLVFLASGVLSGIGPKTALKLINRFGDETFDILENHPKRMMEIKGFSEQKCLKLSKEFKQSVLSRKVITELQELGLTVAESTKVYNVLGSGAAMNVRMNPYILCGLVPGLDFTRAEKIASALEEPVEADKRNFAGVGYIIRHNLWTRGHTCIPADRLAAPASALLGLDESSAYELFDRMICDRALEAFDIGERRFLTLPDVYAAEKNIADRMAEILRYPPFELQTLERDIDRIEEKTGVIFEKKQREAIKTAVTKGLLILTGGPGTGKTTTVKGIIELYEGMRFSIQLAAPTGRAAKRLTEITGREAKTIHRLLEAEFDGNDRTTFRRNAGNKLEANAIILDELSMVDVFLFSAFLDALPKGCRLIMVGDSDQLPPVGPGNVLKDLIASEKIPTVALTEIFRQAKKSLIVTNAHRIIRGEQPVLDVTDKDFFFLERDNAEQTAQTVCDLVSRRLPAAYGVDPVTDVQVLCPSKKGVCGTVNLNNRLQELINPRDKTKNEYKSGIRVFRDGDKLMQTKNDYEIEWKRAREGGHGRPEEGAGVYNGDIGILRRVSPSATELKIDFDGRISDYPASLAGELDHAYAVTVHKSQGSEFRFVILPVFDAAPQLMYRNLLYTAVTRARDMLIIVGSRSQLQKMIDNNKTSKRFSALADFLRL
ncbi:MAG: ATP-dependent RecD-like DNA helicase [Clostridia bacterium]|nr:ATP-dependent RecD-like DNA helicase [Clostridia bacterium]